MSKELKYFSCCENVDSERNGKYYYKHKKYIHNDPFDCLKHKLNRPADEVNDIISKRFEKGFLSSNFFTFRPVNNTPECYDWHEKFIIKSGLRENEDDDVQDEFYLKNKFWESVVYIIENDGNKEKMEADKWTYSMNVVDKIIF